jgi:hypothetical protein
MSAENPQAHGKPMPRCSLSPLARSYGRGVGGEGFPAKPIHPGILKSTLFVTFLVFCISLMIPGNALAEESSSGSNSKSETSGTPSLAEAVSIPQRRDPRRPLPNLPLAKPLTPEEEKAREAARKRGDYTFDDLKFEIKPDQVFAESMLGDSVKDLNGKKLRIRGYILPSSTFQLKGIKQFVLVRDDRECCFGPGAALYDCIMIEMQGDKTAEFSTKPIAVSGTLMIDTESFQYPDGGGHYAIFKMLATEAK